MTAVARARSIRVRSLIGLARSKHIDNISHDIFIVKLSYSDLVTEINRLRRPPDRLSLVQTCLLALVDGGLNAPYDLIRVAKMSIGITSPSLARLKQMGAIEGEEGFRKKTEYRLTPAGRALLRKSVQAVKRDLWRDERGYPYESLPRVIFLLWLYYGREEALTAVEQAKSELALNAKRKARDVESLEEEIAHLQPEEVVEQHDLFQRQNSSKIDPVMLGMTYRLLQDEADAIVLAKQIDCATQLAKIIGRLRSPIFKDDA